MVKKSQSPRSWSTWGTLTLLVGLFIGGCNLALGLDGKTVVADPDDSMGGGSSEECVLNSDCADDTDVCLFRVCSPPCQEDQDCDAGQRCIASDDKYGCVDATLATCEGNSDCPEGTTCFDEQCRIVCLDDVGACLGDQLCTSDGVCRGTDSDRDPSPEPPDQGGACDEVGAFACAGYASAARLVCTKGEWVSGTPCEGGELCDNSRSNGACGEVVSDCLGREPGQAFCDGATRKVCGQDLLDVSEALCDSSQHCTEATGAACAKCLPGEYDCQGQVLRICNDELTGFDEVKTCSDQQCSASAGDCSDFACSVGQKRCTTGGILELCNADRTGFEEIEDCGDGLCDFETLECDECVADAASCASSTSRLVCDDEGDNEVEVDCETGTCSGPDGSAVCSCPAPPADCTGAGHVCRAGQLAECALDENSCLETASTSSCPGVQVCTGSFPNAACTCPTVTQCDAAGEMSGSYCSNSTTRVTCSASGGCQAASSMACGSVAGTELCYGTHPNAKCEAVFGKATTTGSRLNFSANYIYLVPVTVNESVQLRRLGFVGASDGDILMAIYSDNGGEPNGLLTKTAISTVIDGRNEYATNTTPTLAAGTYWIGILAETALFYDTAQPTAPVRFKDYGAPPGGNFSNHVLDSTFSGSSASVATASFYLVGRP